MDTETLIYSQLMPEKPKSVQRPWIKKVDYNSLPGQGRIITTNFYGSKHWRRLRNAFINGSSTHLGTDRPHHNSICIQCWMDGRITPTHTIDHIRRINPSNPYNTMDGRYGEALEWNNLQPLCKSCNAKKTAKEPKNK